MGIQYDILKHNIIALTILNDNIMVYNIVKRSIRTFSKH